MNARYEFYESEEVDMIVEKPALQHTTLMNAYGTNSAKAEEVLHAGESQRNQMFNDNTLEHVRTNSTKGGGVDAIEVRVKSVTTTPSDEP